MLAANRFAAKVPNLVFVTHGWFFVAQRKEKCLNVHKNLNPVSLQADAH